MTNQNNKFHLRLAAIAAILFFAVAASFFLSLPYFKTALAAITGNYAKGTGEALTPGDWNNLPNDFLNVGNTAQQKEGMLLLNTGGNQNGLIVQSGNVGIGTTNPETMGADRNFFANSTAKLDIQTGSGGTGFQDFVAIRHPGQESGVETLGRVGLLLQLGGTSGVDGNKMGGIIYDSDQVYFNGGKLHLLTSDAKRLTIDSTGNVGIGTTTPGAKLEVAGQVKITGGNPGADKVLTSDVSGLADWRTPTAVSAAATHRSAKNFTVVMAMNGTTYCPSGWNIESVSALKGVNGYLYIHIQDRGLLMAGSDYNNYGHEQIYARISPDSQGITNICWKTFLSSSGNPHASVLEYEGTVACPANYNYIPRSAVWGNSDHYTYFNSNGAGLYIGWLETWSYNSQGYNDDGGWTSRYTNDSAQIDTICLRVMGVDDDPATKNGVFPVFLGLQDATQCPSGFNSVAITDVDGSNAWANLTINQSLSILGGVVGWSWSGDNYLSVSNTINNQISRYCYKYLVRSAQPSFQLRAPNAGSCPSGYWSFDAAKVKGTNANAYFMSTGHGLYLGGLYDWWVYDLTQGFLQQNYTSTVTNKFCLKVDGAQ